MRDLNLVLSSDERKEDDPEGQGLARLENDSRANGPAGATSSLFELRKLHRILKIEVALTAPDFRSGPSDVNRLLGKCSIEDDMGLFENRRHRNTDSVT